MLRLTEPVACQQTPDDWFSDDKHVARAAKAECKKCHVRDACLREGIESGATHGIWGGVDFAITKHGRRP